MLKKNLSIFTLLTLSSINVACSTSDTVNSAHNHTMEVSEKTKIDLTPNSSVELFTDRGNEIGTSFEAFLSPHQEPDDEKNTPSIAPEQFRSTAPSVDRNDRKSKGYGILRFTKDLSKAFVDVKVEGVNYEDIVMFHIHCGKPDQLGPIIVDFSISDDITKNFSDGSYSVEINNEDIVKNINSGHGGIIDEFTRGCPIVPGLPGKVQTVAGMQHIALKSELYFNLHTKGQTFFGDIRGILHPVKD